MSRITSINVIKARKLASNMADTLAAKARAIMLKHRTLSKGQEANSFPTLPNKVAKRVDKERLNERLTTLRQQPIDPVLRKYRVLAALPYFDQIEAYVRWLGRRYGVDDAELWADVMDNICEDYDSLESLPEDKDHTINLFMSTARTMVTTGKYRRNRVRSKANLPISGLERQEKSPAYNPWISEKGQSLPSVSADRVHYIGHKAPGLPEQNSFRRSGRVDVYLRSLGLDRLSEVLHNNVRFIRRYGKNPTAHYSINWSQAARDYGIEDDYNRKKFRQKVLELLTTIDWDTGHLELDIPDEYCRDTSYITTESKGWKVTAYHDYRGQPVTQIGRKVGDSSWRTTHKKRADLVEHYQENPGCKCHVCQLIQSDIDAGLVTGNTLISDYLGDKEEAAN